MSIKDANDAKASRHTDFGTGNPVRNITPLMLGLVELSNLDQLKPCTHGTYFLMVGDCQDLVPQVEKWFHDGGLDYSSVKPLPGTVKFNDVLEVMASRELVDWEGQALKDKLNASPSLLDHSFFEDVDRLMSMMSVKSKTFYYHVLRAQCIILVVPPCEH